MSFNAIPTKDFHNREPELARIRGLATETTLPGGRNLLLVGNRGIGKSELLKQACRALFWEGHDVIPFYYRFRKATLKGPQFARDYLSRFLGQILSFSEPSFLDYPGRPPKEFFTFLAGGPLRRLSDLALSIESQLSEKDFPFEIMSALSAPSLAAELLGKRILVVLDDFHLASKLFASQPGDFQSVESVFEDAFRSPFCSHVLSGSTEESLSDMFADDSLLGLAERMYLGPIPEDSAFSMFSSLATSMGITVGAECRGPLATLGGNPLYIRNMVRSFQRFQRRTVSKRDFWECYTHEVSEGQTAFYWTSILNSGITGHGQRRMAIELLMRTLDKPLGSHNLQDAAYSIGLSADSLGVVLAPLESVGALVRGGQIQPVDDVVFRDFVRCAFMREVEGQTPDRIRDQLIERYDSGERDGSFSFELTIPMVTDAELVTASVLEQIWSYTGLDSETAGKLKLALIEACINAMEHSGSYDRKIRLVFTISPESLTITVESPGRAFEPLQHELYTGVTPLEGRRRGFGLAIMQKVMDDVKVERISDRTRVTLVKKLHKEEGHQ